MYAHRNIDIESDRDSLLEFHFSAIYESGTPSFRAIPIATTKAWWFTTSQVNTFLTELADSVKDKRPVAQFWEDGDCCGFCLGAV
jgi:hypothetical protein